MHDKEWEKEFDKRFGLVVKARPPENKAEEILLAWSITNQKIKDFIRDLLASSQRELLEKIVAILAIEVMEVELQKSKEDFDFESAHIHGVKRSIYLINQFKSQLSPPSSGQAGGEKSK